MYTYIYIYIYLFIYLFTFICIVISCIYIYIHICSYHLHIYIYIHTHYTLYIYIYIYIHMYVYVYLSHSPPAAPHGVDGASFTLLDVCVSSLRRGHANILCIVSILTDDPRRESSDVASFARGWEKRFADAVDVKSYQSPAL